MTPDVFVNQKQKNRPPRPYPSREGVWLCDAPMIVPEVGRVLPLPLPRFHSCISCVGLRISDWARGVNGGPTRSTDLCDCAQNCVHHPSRTSCYPTPAKIGGNPKVCETQKWGGDTEGQGTVSKKQPVLFFPFRREVLGRDSQLPEETRVRTSLVEAPEPEPAGDLLRLRELP